MKTIFRFLSVAMLFAAVVSSTLAQDTPAAAPAGDVCNEPAAEQQYNKFVAGYKGKTDAEVKEAISTGKGFLEKYGSCANWKEQVDFVRPQVERLEKLTKSLALDAKFKEFDDAVKAENTEKIYSIGKELLAAQPENLNVMVTMGLAGGKAVAKKDNRFNDDTVRYANMALPLVKAATSDKLCKPDGKGGKICDRVGAYQYEDTRENTISKLTYMPGYINYYGKNDKKGAMPVFYDTVQLAGTHKDAAYIYNAIGEYYIESRAPLGTEIQDLIKKLEAAPAAEKEAIDQQIKPKVALFNGYTERALDAFGRAHKAAKVDTPQGKEFKAAVYKTIQGLYEQRFEKKEGVDAWIATATARPLPNPTSAVTPVEDPAPTTTTTGGVGAANGTGVGAANGTGIGAANGSGVGAPTGKTVGSTAKPAASGSTTAKTKPKNRR